MTKPWLDSNGKKRKTLKWIKLEMRAEKSQQMLQKYKGLYKNTVKYYGFISEFYKTFKEDLMPIFKLSQQLKKKKYFLTHF